MVLEFFSVDLFAVFGFAECTFATGFYQQFMFSFWLLPGTMVCSALPYLLLRLRLAPARAGPSTPGSARTRLFTILFLAVYSLYTGVATKMLRLFKCQSVQSVWFLTADYRLQCFDAQWYFHAAFAGIAILVFIIAFPPAHHSGATASTSTSRRARAHPQAHRSSAVRHGVRDYPRPTTTLTWWTWAGACS